MSDAIRVFAGDCTTTFEGSGDREQRGDLVVLVKPDDTVLVHDREGYRPVAWLTRPETLVYEGTTNGLGVTDGTDGTNGTDGTDGETGFRLTATDGDARLRVVAHESHGLARYPASAAGSPVGTCPDCAGVLVNEGSDVACLDCGVSYRLPVGADVTEDTCSSCGLPTMAVERGRAFRLCVDRECESLEDAVRRAFDREWECPDCDGDLRILNQGHLFAGCEAYPDCEAAFSIPTGVVADDCSCGLPLFETSSGQRCLDASCERAG